MARWWERTLFSRLFFRHLRHVRHPFFTAVLLCLAVLCNLFSTLLTSRCPSPPSPVAFSASSPRLVAASARSPSPVLVKSCFDRKADHVCERHHPRSQGPRPRGRVWHPPAPPDAHGAQADRRLWCVTRSDWTRFDHLRRRRGSARASAPRTASVTTTLTRVRAPPSPARMVVGVGGRGETWGEGASRASKRVRIARLVFLSRASRLLHVFAANKPMIVHQIEVRLAAGGRLFPRASPRGGS